MAFQIIGLFILLAFYGCYFGKMLSQKKKGIQTDQIGKGKKGFVKWIELTMKVATILVPIVEVLSICAGISGLPDSVRLLGVCVALLGDAVFICSVITMRDSWRAGVSETDKTELVTQGIYKFSRNPAFLGFDLVYIGILLMFFNWVLFAVSVFAAAMFHLQIVNVEENFLLMAFGEEYLVYKKQVCRYLGRKTKRQGWIPLTMLLILVILVFVVTGKLSYSGVMERNWGISLPYKALCREVYEKDSGSSFHGDGIRYHVFSYKYEDYIDLMFAWRHQEDATIFHARYSEAANEWLPEISVEEAYYPDYENCLYWYKAQDDNSELIIFWDREENLLYVLESFL